MSWGSISDREARVPGAFAITCCRESQIVSWGGGGRAHFRNSPRQPPVRGRKLG